MSSVDTRPPQTYSRLFRPWDSKVAAENNRKCIKNKCEYNINKNDNFEDIIKSAQIAAVGLNTDHTQLQQYPIDITDPNNHFGLTQINDLYFGNSLQLAAANNSVYGIDPIAMSLMEQEYARVVAEDAHIKALNSRKQRPKKFKCPHCDVAFSNNGQLKGHIRIHTGERPFKCDVESCGKTFTRNEELTRHKRIHTGLRPFGCSTCGKKFGRRDHLKKHMKTHMPQERQLGSAIFVPMYPYLYGY